MSRHRIFAARSAESVGDLMARLGRDVGAVVVRRDPRSKDFVVSALPDKLAADLSACELAEAFGG